MIFVHATKIGQNTTHILNSFFHNKIALFLYHTYTKPNLHLTGCICLVFLMQIKLKQTKVHGMLF